MNQSSWIDITVPITNKLPVWPGDKAVRVYRSSAIGMEGSDVNVTHLSFSAHTGTHIDAPLHFLRNGADVSALDLDTLVGFTKIFHISDPQQITFSELKELPIEYGDTLIFRTTNSDVDWDQKPFMNDFVYLSTNAAQYLIKMGVKCIGVDYLSIAGEDNGKEVHQMLLKQGVIIIEGLKLGGVVPGIYEMIALPLKIRGADGAPARVLVKRIKDLSEAEVPL